MSAAEPRGSLGPRLAGRLTAELILRSPQYLNALKQYEIDLRGNKISAIENLGVTENQFDSIDLSDNSIVRLEGFPRLPRLTQLLLSNNRITRIGKGCHEQIGNLQTLILTNNRLSNLQDLDHLAEFSKLTMLSLMGNPVATKPNYRAYVIAKCKALKYLDFKKVKQQERADAAALFPTDQAAAEHSAKTFEVNEEFEAVVGQAGQAGSQPDGNGAAEGDNEQPGPAGSAAEGGGVKKGPTADQLIAIKAAIANAATMEEIRRLEEALTSGHLPSEFQLDSKAPGGRGGGQPAGDAEMTDAAPAVANGGGDGSKPTDMAVG